MTTTPPPRHLSIGFYVDSVPFTPAVIHGETSLGGSESACIALAKGLAARGHDVHIFATKMEEGTGGEYEGVFWHPAELELPEVMKFAAMDVFVSLRMAEIFRLRIPAKLNILWNQDLLIQPGAMVGVLPQVDVLAYVSNFHRQQWEAREATVKAYGRDERTAAWVVGNPIDISMVPKAAIGVSTGSPRIIHISRPERGLDALLAMWPAIRNRWPEATLALARYSSMYDAGGWGKVCAAYDRRVERVNSQIGGIEYLGELTKPALYRELSRAHLMLYPTSDVSAFAETNCIAVTEAQACGLPVVASWQGALPETLHRDAGILIPGDTSTPEVQEEFIEAIARVLDPATRDRMAQAGRAWASRCDLHVQAEQWEERIWEFLTCRSATDRLGVLRRFLNNDDHAAARVLCDQFFTIHDDFLTYNRMAGQPYLTLAERADQAGHHDLAEAARAASLCHRVIAQEEQGPADYATYALPDPIEEGKINARLQVASQAIVDHLGSRPSQAAPKVLDMACGNGSMAILMAQAMPHAHIHGVDYSEEVLQIARRGAEQAGVADRCTFTQGGWEELTGKYDAVFCGEFLEHVERPWKLIDKLESVCKPGGRVVLTTPCGPFSEMLDHGTPRKRGHVHSFDMRDISAMFGPKANWQWRYLEWGNTPKLNHAGYWVVAYSPGGKPAGTIDYARKILVERPYPRVFLSMIMKDGAATILNTFKSVYGVVDRVVVYDTGSTDSGPRMAADWGKGGDYSLTPVEVVMGDWPGDFSVARNRCLDHIIATYRPGPADYILWLDADEVLDNARLLREFATGTGPYDGYAIRQWHVHIDRPNYFDKPIRLFRAGCGAKFYGVVHEQPETTINHNILPTLLTEGINIIHSGYTSHHLRTYKMRVRNLPLLTKELRGGGTHPPRELAYVLAMRDYVNLAAFRLEETQGVVDAQAARYLVTAVNVYDSRKYGDPTSMYHEVAWPFYQQALEWLAQSGMAPTGNWRGLIQVVWGVGAGQGGVNGQLKPARMWVRSTEEAEGLIKFRTSKILEPLSMPKLFLTPADEMEREVVVQGGWGRDSDPTHPAHPSYSTVVEFVGRSR